MNRNSRFGGIPAGNPLVNALMLVVGALAVGAAIVLGFFAFVVLSGIVLILAGIIGIRLWWLNRKLRGNLANHAERESDKSASRVIEGEYTVVSTRRKHTSRD